MVVSVVPSSSSRKKVGMAHDGERTPLLTTPSASSSPSRQPQTRQQTPLPLKQVLVLCAMRFAEPICFTLIFPFVNAMLEDIHVTDDPKKVGYYAGVIESLFAFTTFSTVLAWGRLSDRIGRRPVLCLGLCGVFLSNIMFGMSRSFPQMVVARALGGVLNGNVAVIKSAMGEITDESNQGRGFSFLPLAWSVGSVIGPMIGGYLSNPAKHFPHVFGNIPFFIKFPYALPCLVGSLFPLFGALAGFFFLEESLPSRRATPPLVISASKVAKRAAFFARTSTTIPVNVPSPSPSGTSTPARRSSLEESETLKPPPLSDLWTRDVIVALLVYAFLALETVALDAVLILFCYTRVSLGGLGFDEADIGKALSFSGVCTVVTQLVLFPPLQRRLGTVRMYKTLMALWPAVFALLPVMSYLAKLDIADGRGRDRVWIVMIVFLLIRSVANMSYGANMLSITNASPSRRLLGTLNGVAQMCSSLCRSIGPLFASSLFAFSIANNVLGGWLVYYVMIALGVLGAFATLTMRETVGGWRSEAVAASVGGEGQVAEGAAVERPARLPSSGLQVEVNAPSPPR
ncbi:MFS general substrate transporter [Meredithblackwellia eburnea MCA 4105]